MTLKSYKLLGGKHPETATLKNTLACLGVKAPHTGKPFTEEMLLGIGGGLGIGYILWEFKKYASAILVMAFQNKWNYPVKFLGNLCNRLALKAVFKETGGAKAAAGHLTEALNMGVPAIAWVDQFHLPYMFFPELYNGCFGWIVNAYGVDEKNGKVFIDDLGKKPFTLSSEQFATARARIPSYKNRLLLVESAQDFDLKIAVTEGIRDCVDYLGAKSETFALPALEKWAKLMTDAKNPKGWPVVFKKRNGLYSTLKSIFASIELQDTGGSGMRGMYADFLTEAGTALNKPELKEVAAQYRKVARLWTSFANSCLPETVKPLKETKVLLVKKYDLLKTQGDAGLKGIETISRKLNEMEARLNKDFPMSDNEIAHLFSSLQAQLYEIHHAEENALAALRGAC